MRLLGLTGHLLTSLIKFNWTGMNFSVQAQEQWTSDMRYEAINIRLFSVIIVKCTRRNVVVDWNLHHIDQKLKKEYQQFFLTVLSNCYIRWKPIWAVSTAATGGLSRTPNLLWPAALHAAAVPDFAEPQPVLRTTSTTASRHGHPPATISRTLLV